MKSHIYYDRSPVHIRCQSRVYTSIVLQVFGLPNYHACLYFYINYDCLPFSSLYNSTAASARRALEFILEDTVQEIHDHFKTKLAASDIPASHNWEVNWRNIMVCITRQVTSLLSQSQPDRDLSKLDDFVFRRDMFILMEFSVYLLHLHWYKCANYVVAFIKFQVADVWFDLSRAILQQLTWWCSS